LAKDLADLLTHAEGTAGALMATELVKVNQNWTVLKCVREMRRQAEGIDVVHAVYVVDDNDILLGSLSLKKLLTTSTKTEISEIFEKSIHSVTSTSEDAEIAKIMKKYDLFVVPVVDEIGRLLGRITLDDAVDIIQEEADSNYQLISGLSDEVSNEDGLFQTTKARLPWLLIGLLGGVLTSTVISENESEITLIPQIVFFIPLIAAMGGNVGVQSSAIVVQALANSTLQKNIWQRLARELGVGLFNGLICSLVIVGYSWSIGQGLLFATAVGSSLLAVVLFASLFGTAIPWILNKYNIDPALATGPFITTTNDVLGLSIYFAIANALL
jgi:magnesium transporter